MGALHAGHLSLLRRAREENDRVAASIFVNPAQFMPGEDFERYPRPWEADVKACRDAGVDVLFAPPPEEMYRPGAQTSVSVHELSGPLCGLSRGRGHFTGVATVVAKLFNLVRPARAYFGQKDAQQAILVRRMAEDLDFPVDVVACPTVREPDGLALSSRNAYLTPAQRKIAPVLYQGLCLGRNRIAAGESDPNPIYVEMAEYILTEGGEGLELDYLHLVSPVTLEDAATVEGPTLLAGAVRLGNVRLIDNLLACPGE